jgi:hypothetical protein
VLLSFRWNYSIANHCSDAPRRELAREPLPTNRAKAPVQTSARNRASLLPPTDAIMSSGRLEQLNILNMIMPVRRKARAASATEGASGAAAAEGASGAAAAEGASGAAAAEGASGAAAAEAERNPRRRPARAPPCETD